MKIVMRLGLLLMFLPLGACSVMGVQKYDPYFKNTQALANVKTKFSKIEIKGTNQAAINILTKSALSCRLTTFNMPANENLGDYIRDAMKDELDAGGKLSPSGTGLTIAVNKIESDASGLDKGSWTLDITYNGAHKSKTVKTTYQYESAFAADTACRNTAAALQTAVRENFLEYFKSLPKN